MRNNISAINQIKANIKTELKERNRTTEKLCKALGQDRFFIYRMTDNTPLSKIISIAKELGCTPAELLKGL